MAKFSQGREGDSRRPDFAPATALSVTETPSTLADRLAIMHALTLYCHGVDRCDPATLSRAFWPDAAVDYGAFKGPASAFIPAVIAALTPMRCTSHAIGNVMIEFEGSRAKVESKRRFQAT